MVELSNFVVVFSLMVSPSASAKNGSSGIGTASVPISEGIEASSLGGKVRAQGDQIVNALSGAPLLSISKMSRQDFMEALEAGQLFRAQLGSVESFEYAPDFKDKGPRNYWVVCDEIPDKCRKLSPHTNSVLISELIGTLTRTRAE